ncbi:hypothetical protein H310_00907 [Aphanomyces invadans]|uniref:Uncharacterized protein n=1 Tax=Aphanomyces invadans TaxID=157072 RepID=A0A024UPQ5_9STRA|nr:hypothetical protein H310_00907 [Aphanomyces invadans]ETW08284.1 hypothetical protein H310_00907 [Aphanomyces invadans]|eukprot:XP_008862089.1 hypothetical protein H310_00907 [Aphanomyces invadans]
MPSSVISSASTKNHPGIAGTGVLELKLKKKLAADPQAVVYSGIQSPVKTKVRGGKGHHKRNPLANVRLDNLSIHEKSFKKEREDIMVHLKFPSPTRKYIEHEVVLKKHKDKYARESLPPVAGAFKKRPIPSSTFPSSYTRGAVPICIEPTTGGNALRWTKPLAEIDYSVMLPLLLDGTRESQEPYHFLATKGSIELLQYGRQHPEKVHACLHKVVAPLRVALNTRDQKLVCETLKVMQILLDVEGIGVALVPYYRQLLPTLNLFKNSRHNIGDSIDFGQRHNQDLGDLVRTTLEKMERVGGPDAYVNIKYMVPTYEGINLG